MNCRDEIHAICRTAVVAAWLVLASGCGGGGDANTEPKPGFGDAPLVTCLGVDVSKLEPILVSPQGVNGLCGLGGSQPCKDVDYALRVAGEFNVKTVAIQHGFYQTTKPIALNNGVDVHGSCLFGGEGDQGYRTVIEASPPPGVPAITAAEVTATMSGVVVIGKDGSGASIAMALANSHVGLSRTVLVSGKGADAAPALDLPVAPRALGDRCYRPGGVASTSQFGTVDFSNLSWVAGMGGAGAGGDDTGPGGAGGRQGGASIAMLLVNSTVTTAAPEYNRIVADSGGTGATGQAGPSFGMGGGANSGGAGGNGGPSIGVALGGASSWPSDASIAYASAGGAGGAGGAAGVDAGQCSGDPGAPGDPGGSASVYTYEPLSGSAP